MAVNIKLNAPFKNIISDLESILAYVIAFLKIDTSDYKSLTVTDDEDYNPYGLIKYTETNMTYTATGGETLVSIATVVPSGYEYSTKVYKNGLLLFCGNAGDYYINTTDKRLQFNSSLTSGDKLNIFINYYASPTN